MHRLVLTTFLVVTTAAYLVSLNLLPAPFKLLPELMSGVLLLPLTIAGLNGGFRRVPAKYWALLIAAVAVLASGVVANGVESGPIINGARSFLRALPLFAIPFVFTFTATQLRSQLWVVGAIALVQVPLAVTQRLIAYATGHGSGDTVFGTLMISGILTVFLVSAICVAAAFAARGRLGWLRFTLFSLALLVAISVNETKVTVLLLPLGLLLAFGVASPRGRRLRNLGMATALLGFMAAVFVPVYDYYNAAYVEHPVLLSDYATDPKMLQEYLDTDAAVGSSEYAGRADATVVPFAEISRSPISLALGFGMGNASSSSLGTDFSGAYDALYSSYIVTSSSAVFLLETGLLGCLLVVLFQRLCTEGFPGGCSTRFWTHGRVRCRVAGSDPGHFPGTVLPSFAHVRIPGLPVSLLLRCDGCAPYPIAGARRLTPGQRRFSLSYPAPRPARRSALQCCSTRSASAR